MKCLTFCGIFLLTSTLTFCAKDEPGGEPETAKDKSKENKEEDQKRKWAGLSAWGKRDSPLIEHNDLKRGWSDMSAWGKRGSLSNVWDKRKWAAFNTWGKKRWMTAWGKRWAPMATWGKRSQGQNALLNLEDDVHKADIHKRDTEHIFPAKRHWNHFVTWGKRSLPLKRKWADMSAWGKRADDQDNDAEKRKWSSFTAWGKRNDLNDIADALVDKKWAMSSWGKRDLYSQDLNDLQKKWSMSTWGKRDLYDGAAASDEAEGEPVNYELNKRKWSPFTSWGKRGKWRVQKWHKRPWLWAKRRRGWSAMSSWGK